MRTDTEIKLEGVKALTSALGEVEAEKFIAHGHLMAEAAE